MTIDKDACERSYLNAQATLDQIGEFTDGIVRQVAAFLDTLHSYESTTELKRWDADARAIRDTLDDIFFQITRQAQETMEETGRHID